MIKAMYLFLALALCLGALSFFNQFFNHDTVAVVGPEEVMCTMDAQQCPDGSYVGRTGKKCEFVCPDVLSTTTDKAAWIVLDSPLPQAVVTTPLKLSGKARGNWFFEASFPVVLTKWDGLVIAKGSATAVGDWMTSEFVPFTLDLTFNNPYQPGDPDFMKQGKLILRKDNPSGEPQNDDALELVVRFAP